MNPANIKPDGGIAGPRYDDVLVVLKTEDGAGVSLEYLYALQAASVPYLHHHTHTHTRHCMFH